MTIAAVQTRYKGYNFRSRLEARWAVFFDALGLSWEYEPEGFVMDDGVYYLPDFKVYYPGRDERERHVEWFEVKGDIRDITHEEWVKMLAFSNHHDLVVLDGVPSPRMYLRPFHALKIEIVTPFGSGHQYEERLMPPPYKANPQSEGYERYGLALWSGKGRLWWDWHSDFFDPTTYFGSGTEIEDACEAARSARFEHGQSGPT